MELPLRNPQAALKPWLLSRAQLSNSTSKWHLRWHFWASLLAHHYSTPPHFLPHLLLLKTQTWRKKRSCYGWVRKRLARWPVPICCQGWSLHRPSLANGFAMASGVRWVMTGQRIFSPSGKSFLETLAWCLFLYLSGAKQRYFNLPIPFKPWLFSEALFWCCTSFFFCSDVFTWFCFNCWFFVFLILNCFCWMVPCHGSSNTEGQHRIHRIICILTWE